MGIALLSSLTIGRNSSLSLIEFVKKMKQRTLSLVVLSTIFGIVLSSDVTQEKGNVEEMEQGRIRLDVYYESLCPDSRMFLINQLGRHYDSIASFVHVRLIPFGKARFEAKKNGGYDFDCQHGARECQGNMLHACGIEYSNSTVQGVEYAVCLMRSLANSEKCVKTFGLDYDTIKKCALTFVPWLVFNQKWSAENQDGGLDDLKATVCKMAP